MNLNLIKSHHLLYLVLTQILFGCWLNQTIDDLDLGQFEPIYIAYLDHRMVD